MWGLAVELLEERQRVSLHVVETPLGEGFGPLAR